jgi:heterodisulfide reductase subunit A
MTFDLVVLLVGFIPRPGNSWMCRLPFLKKGDDGFLVPSDEHLHNNGTVVPGLFLTGTVKGPGSIAETIADARSTALQVYEFLMKKEIMEPAP